MKSKSLPKHLLSMTLVAGAVAMTMASLAQAAENRVQRYTAGLGGSDMTSMLVPGWYGQVAMIHYHATKLKGNDGSDYALPGSVPASTLAGAAGQAVATQLSNPSLLVPVATSVGTQLAGRGMDYSTSLSHFRSDAYVMLPRITYLSASKFLGAHLGFTAMLPLMERQTSLAGQTVFTDRSAAINQGVLTATGSAPLAAGVAAGVTSQVQSSVNSGVSSQLASRNGSNTGVGDLEMAPVLNWEIGDHQTVTLTPTIIFPTGEYKKQLAVNPGFGNFYTFRPSVQYGFIGDGWDVGARAVLSFNTRNNDTKYRSGNMFNLDVAVMKFVTEDIRLGVQGYAVQQLTADSSDDATAQATIDAAGGNKMHSYALGPAVAWLKNGGEMMMEGKILREFDARNKSEGTTYMLTISKPFGL
jgi:hypothetical protein